MNLLNYSSAVVSASSLANGHSSPMQRM